MSDEIKEILDKLKDRDWYNELDLTGTMWIELTWEETHLLSDYITNLQQENKKLKILNKTAEIYIRNHTIDYIEDGIECVKPSGYFNMLWAQEMLNGNTEGFEILVEEAKKEIEGDDENEER